MKAGNANGAKPPGEGVRDARMKCDEIRDLLFDYMSRELGSARSVLVREHVRKCAECRAAAAEMQETIRALREASRSSEGLPVHLSDVRRLRVQRAYMHPVIAWVERHHVAVSIVVAALVIITIFVRVRQRTAWNLRVPPGIPVRVIPKLPEGDLSGGERAVDE